MDFFSEYLQPLTTWVYNHPEWALLLTFIISMGESLAFIGSIIPGTVTMTAIGILAGSGAMRVDLTLLAATLGAIIGDGLSYSLGRIFSDRLGNMWPFARYPKWLDYGKEYFTRHGGKSVLIGRFTGPLRSIIPIIAGIMGMNRLHFFIANVTSAIGWAFLYVIPGVLIGAASSELSPKSSSKLFIVILVLLATVWILSLFLKWLFIRISHWLNIGANAYWTSLINHSRLGGFAKFITPMQEREHHSTAMMFFLLLFFLVLTPLLVIISTQSEGVSAFNESVYQFCLSIRTHDFDSFFIIERLNISFLSLLSFASLILFYAFYHRDWRLLRFWLSLIITSNIMAAVLSLWISSPIQISSLADLGALTFPLKRLLFATSLFGFLVFYMATFYKQTLSIILSILLLTMLLFSGMALIYLGEEWVINVIIIYLLGFTISLIHWILYRRISSPRSRSLLLILLSILVLIISASMSSFMHFGKITKTIQPCIKQYVIHQKAWWNQQQPILPLYSKNRFGKKSGLMNIQYLGSISALQQSLENAGWKKQHDSLFYSLILRIGKQESSVTLPLMAQLYKNKKPYLMMSYGLSNDNDGVIIRFWRSNYHIYNHHQVIWLGSIQEQITSKYKNKTDLIDNLLASLKGYEIKKITINEKIDLLKNTMPPTIWIIDELYTSR